MAVTSVRRGTPADAAFIARFNCAMAFETERKQLDAVLTAQGVAALFEYPDRGFYLVAEAAGQPVGCLMVTHEWSDWRNADWWWIQSVYVEPAHRGQGLYRLLYASVRQLAKEDGRVCGFRLYVEKENQSAQRIYEHLGMREAPYMMYEESLDA